MIDYNSEDVVPTDLSHKEDFGAIDEIADVINDEHSENTDEYNNVDTEEKLRLNLLVPKKNELPHNNHYLFCKKLSWSLWKLSISGEKKSANHQTAFQVTSREFLSFCHC